MRAGSQQPGRFAVVSLDEGRGEFLLSLTRKNSWDEPSPSLPSSRAQTRSVISDGGIPLRSVQPPSAGRRFFWIFRGTPGDADRRKYSFERIETDFVGRSQHADIWIDRSISALFPDRSIRQMLDIAENAYGVLAPLYGPISYPEDEVAARGPVQYCDRGRKAVGEGAKFLSSPGNFATYVIVRPSASMEGAAYMQEDAFSPQSVLNCENSDNRSAELPATIVLMLTGSRDVPSYFVSNVPHELQHAMSFIHRVIEDGVPQQTGFVDEGLSMLASDVASERLDPAGSAVDLNVCARDARAFVEHPQDFSILSLIGRHPSGGIVVDASGAYGGAYLLQRYLYDRLGPDYWTAMARSRSTGIQAIEEASGLSWPVIMAQFAGALMSASSNGDDRTAFARLLRGELTDAFGRPFQMPPIRYLPIEGNRRPLILKGGIEFFESSDVPVEVRAVGAGSKVIAVPAPTSDR